MGGGFRDRLGGVPRSIGALTRWLAAMALATGLSEAKDATLVCAQAPPGSRLGAMPAMYLLMSAFHLAPWLKLTVDRRGPD